VRLPLLVEKLVQKRRRNLYLGFIQDTLYGIAFSLCNLCGLLLQKHPDQTEKLDFYHRRPS
jgi:hypothetical protein